MDISARKPSALAFGEVLWDIFPDKSVIGGAPYNFAAHFVLMGGNATLLSAVGDDELGTQTLRLIRHHGVSDRFVSRLPNTKTGVCRVTLDENGMPSYDLSQIGAYDNISLTPELENEIRSGNFDLFYFGTLAQRSKQSRDSLGKILCEYSGNFAEVLFDVNIRQSYYTKDILKAGLWSCTTLKFSREEQDVFPSLGLVPKGCISSEDICSCLSEKYSIPRIIVTLDRDGSFFYDRDEDRIYRSEKPSGTVVSTVGAGDSYSAAFMYSRLSGKTPEKCIGIAARRAAYVVAHTEAIPK